MTTYLILFIIGIIGFSISFYINKKKRGKKKLVCPVGASCDTVINSDFSKFFGVPVEYIGMVYYGLVALFYGLSFFSLFSISSLITFVVFLITLLAFLFSAYLTFIQAAVLRNWCSWCLFSASLCTLIFILAVFALPGGLIDFLESTYDIIFSFHILALSLGVGGSTATVVLFVRFLDDLKISHTEAKAIRMISDIIWIGLIFLLITALGLYLPELFANIITSKFFIEFVIWIVLVVISGLLHFFVAPRLQRISYGEEHAHKKGELKEIHKFAFGLGGMSLVSWYFLLFVAVFDGLFENIVYGIGIYSILLLFAVLVSQYLESYFAKK